jgi:hypothetical protein
VDSVADILEACFRHLQGQREYGDCSGQVGYRFLVYQTIGEDQEPVSIRLPVSLLDQNSLYPQVPSLLTSTRKWRHCPKHRQHCTQ